MGQTGHNDHGAQAQPTFRAAAEHGHAAQAQHGFAAAGGERTTPATPAGPCSAAAPGSSGDVDHPAAARVTWTTARWHALRRHRRVTHSAADNRTAGHALGSDR
ncbi:hypothetical protein [Dactylosporangium sp. NPDC049140]|uniref:hypothetical protein n=1 Tax=Dactylosporangium sp. NPDC049140 TaxID=3155647 RepID=UPI0034067D47